MKKSDLIIFFGVLAAFVFVYCWTFWQTLPYPFSIEYEGPTFYSTYQVASGQNIYDASKLSGPPWWGLSYTPLFMCIGAVFFKLFGPCLTVLRAMSAVSLLGCVYFFYRLLRNFDCSVIVALIACFFLAGFGPIFVFSTLGRVDMLGLCLSLWGLERFIVAWRSEERGQDSTVAYVLAAVPLVLAFYVKQTQAICAVAAFLFLLWTKKYRAAIKFGATAALITVVIGAPVQLATGGFLECITYFGRCGFDQIAFNENIHCLTGSDQFKLELLLPTLLLSFIWQRDMNKPERLPYLIFGMSFASMLVAMGLRGTGHNFVILPYVALVWWWALRAGYLPNLALKALLVSTVVGLESFYFYMPALSKSWPTVAETKDTLTKYHLKGKLVLSEDTYLNYWTESTPAMIYCTCFLLMWQNHPQLLVPLIDALKRQEFAAVIFNALDCKAGGDAWLWPKPVIKTLLENYDQVPGEVNGSGNRSYLFLPKKR